MEESLSLKYISLNSWKELHMQLGKWTNHLIHLRVKWSQAGYAFAFKQHYISEWWYLLSVLLSIWWCVWEAAKDMQSCWATTTCMGDPQDVPGPGCGLESKTHKWRIPLFNAHIDFQISFKWIFFSRKVF